MKTFKVLFYYGESAGISVTADSCEEAKKSVEKWLKEYARLEPPRYIEAASYKISESLDKEHTAYEIRQVQEVIDTPTETKD